MRSTTEVHTVFHLAHHGLSKKAIARLTGISRATVRDWLTHGETAVLNRPMRLRSGARPRAPCPQPCSSRSGLDQPAYAYLLGQYLGDGCISEIHRNFRLRIACCDAYPNIMEECVAAIGAVLPCVRVGRVQSVGCTEIYATSFHWPCLFPQHGPGRKHERPIVLEDWQVAIALDGHPDRFVRGLIQSDGCRFINRVRGANGLPYAYPRYTFTNHSSDIRALFGEVCDRLGVEWRQMNRYNLSVARRGSVAILDRLVGPKT